MQTTLSGDRVLRLEVTNDGVRCTNLEDFKEYDAKLEYCGFWAYSSDDEKAEDKVRYIEDFKKYYHTETVEIVEGNDGKF